MQQLIKVKVTYPFDSVVFRGQLPNKGSQWDDFIFFINPEETDEVYDYWVVYENLHKPSERTFLRNKRNTLFFTGEPPTVKKYSEGFLRQFATIITSHTDIKHPSVLYTQQSLPWSIRKSYDELNAISQLPKTKFMSLISSRKTITEGHKKRLDFALKLKECYPEYIDLYGRGIKDFEDKWDVLAPYKYHLSIENSSFKNYFTEKITDAYLCNCFPVYYGCTNLEDYFDPLSFIKIDIKELDACRRVIDHLIKDEFHYEKSISHLNIARNACLNEYNLFPAVVKLIRNTDIGSTANYELKKIRQTNTDILKSLIKNIFS